MKHLLPVVPENEDPIARQARHEFEITDKHFDEASSPQRLFIQFTNRGNNIIQVKKVKYSDNSLGLHDSAILPSYRKESGGYYSIPFDPNSAEIAPGQSLSVEIHLAQIWKREDINRMTGNWGYLRLDILYQDKPVEVFNAI